MAFMLRSNRFVPFVVLLAAAVVAVLVPQGHGQAATHFSDTPEATALLPEVGTCEIALTAEGSISTTETAGAMLSCSEETIWSIWDMIDEECDGSGYALVLLQ